MTRLLLLSALAFLPSVVAQNALVLPRFVREQQALLTSTKRNQSHISSLNEADQFFSFEELLEIVDASGTDGLSEECAEDMRLLIAARFLQFEYPEFAAQVYLPMRDSGGRIHQAILRGHISFAGHYSECAQIDVKLTGRERPFKADYFKVVLDTLFHPNGTEKCMVSGTGAVVGYSVGICLPASCSSAELESVFVDASAKHNPVCKITRTNDAIDDLGVGFYVTVSIMGVIIALCVLSGFADYFFSEYLSDKPISRSLPWRLLMSFSLYTNVAGIFETTGGKKEGQIAPIHCMRFFSMCWVVLGHLTGSIMGVVANPLDVLALSKDLTTEFILNAFFSVDSFFFIGGLLLTFLWFKNYNRNPKQTNSPGAWAMVYIHRILRLSPPYFIMVIFYTFVLPQLYRNSPFNMNPLATATDFCKETWALEFTYLHNIIDNQRQCLGYSWYLATDMQIFFFTPLIIIPLALKPVIGFLIAAAIFIVSSGLNIFLVYHYHWPSTLQFTGEGDPLMTDFNEYMPYMYMSPIIRCQIYIVGMLVGWFLQSKQRLRINPIINIVLWILSLTLALFLLLGLHSENTGPSLPIFWRAMYSAFSRPAWGLVLGWLVVSCYYGYGGPINAFMSWHVWVPLGRLSYCGYLVHYPMIYFVLAQTHDEVYFSSFTDFVIRNLIPLIALTYFVSIFWSACFEISFGKLEMLLIGGSRGRVKPQKEAPIERKSSKSDVEASDEVVYKERL